MVSEAKLDLCGKLRMPGRSSRMEAEGRLDGLLSLVVPPHQVEALDELNPSCDCQVLACAAPLLIPEPPGNLKSQLTELKGFFRILERPAGGPTEDAPTGDLGSWPLESAQEETLLSRPLKSPEHTFREERSKEGRHEPGGNGGKTHGNHWESG